MEKKNYIVGIDIGSSNIVMIVGSQNAAGEMVVDALVEKASKGVNAGVVENINQVSECIKAAKAELEEKLGIRISEAYASISGAFIRCAPLSDHVYVRDPQNGISQYDVDALFLRMREVIAPDNEVIMERIPQNYVVDNNKEVIDPVGAFGRRLSSTFNFILCEKTPLERLNMAFKHSGLQLAGTYANSMIISEAVLSEDEKNEGVAVVDIGGSTTDVAIYHGNIIRHVATIPMGANAINRDIHLHGVPERSVESLKVKYGSAVAEFVSEQKLIQIPSMGHHNKGGVLRRNLAAIIEARLTDIAEYVKSEIKDSGYSGRLAYGVVLTGGSASMDHIDELFHRVTGHEVRIATATSGLDEASRNNIELPEYTSAVALLLKGAEKGSCSVVARPVIPTPQPTPYQQPVRPAHTVQPSATSGTIAQPTQSPIATPAPTPTEMPTPQQEEVYNTDSTTTTNEEGEKSGWFKKFIGKLTDGINNTFDKAEDEEI